MTVMTDSCEFHRNAFSIVAKLKKYRRHGTEARTDRRKICLRCSQHRLQRHKRLTNCMSVFSSLHIVRFAERVNCALLRISSSILNYLITLWRLNTCTLYVDYYICCSYKQYLLVFLTCSTARQNHVFFGADYVHQVGLRYTFCTVGWFIHLQQQW